jgi:hypothetical protein
MVEVRNYDPRYPVLTRLKDPKASVDYYDMSFAANNSYTPQSNFIQPIQNQLSLQQTETPKKSKTGVIIIVVVIVIVVLIVVGVLVYYFAIYKNPSAKKTNTNTPATGGLNDTCSATNPCLPLYTCENNLCKSNVNVPCTVTTDCSQSVYEEVCLAYTCKYPNGESCTSATQCASNMCSSTNVCAACSNSSQCPTGRSCVGGSCQ